VLLTQLVRLTALYKLSALPMMTSVWQDNQKDLEHATEQLSEYLERDLTSDMLADIKQKVQDKSRLLMCFALFF